MQDQRFTEKDWKLFRSKIAGWQEAYMDRLNREYIELLSGEGKPSDKFWKLEERLEKDKMGVGVQIRMSRSKLIYNIGSLIDDDVIGMEDLEEFSDKLKEVVRFWVEE